MWASDMQYTKKQSGFTLIEVLVASVILFSSIAIVGVVYKGVLVSTVKAEKHMHLTSVVSTAVDKIERKLKTIGNSAQQEDSGTFVLLGVTANWHAVLVQSKSPPDLFDPDSGKSVQIEKKYNLWRVELKLNYKGTSQVYNFSGLNWSD
ncbi:prepilin-type N-terminal cleavage/methylation domain-containing protein [Pseudoalteromonas sp. Scap03]|nr:prepilin-type N-terminal cleavage/methylation domain-containing protein [Pseudoalteromonas sp. Scap03]QLE80416.1 prepilin-type N-terminal cleavage/methylation domain-containing protein [Pseudoalteromonas sp. Scap25]QLE88359.1 prepilin-type N-terminal cleavage/methylation domain-containing protein [Pseudoalteromonas sp. Scap06]